MGTVELDSRSVCKLLRDWGWTEREGSGDHKVFAYREGSVAIRHPGPVNDHATTLISQAMGMPWARIKLGPKRLASPSRRRVVQYLLERNGRVADAAGQVTAPLMEYLGLSSTAATTSLLSGMEEDGMVKRWVEGKRTHAIELVQDSPIVAICARRVEAAIAQSEIVPVPVEVLETGAEPEATEPEVTEPPARTFRAMLESMLRYVENLEASHDNYARLEVALDEQQRKVAALVEYGQTQRKRMQKLQGEMDALRRKMR